MFLHPAKKFPTSGCDQKFVKRVLPKSEESRDTPYATALNFILIGRWLGKNNQTEIDAANLIPREMLLQIKSPAASVKAIKSMHRGTNGSKFLNLSQWSRMDWREALLRKA